MFRLFNYLALASLASAKGFKTRQRPAASLTAHVSSAEDYCLFVPAQPHTDIGEAEGSGDLIAYCTDPVDGQGQLPPNFLTSATLSANAGYSGMRQIQLTGCIAPETLDRLNPQDGGGQTDSSGGDGGRGMPPGSICSGYAHYVELIEPDDRRACIRCCDSFDDCQLSHDTAGCPIAIPGNYTGCE